MKWNSYNKINHFKASNSVTFNTFTTLCIHYLVPKHFCHPKRKPCLLSSYSPFSLSPSPGKHLLLFLWIYLFWIFPINAIIQYVTFCVCLLLLSIMFLRFIQVIAGVRTLFFLCWIIFQWVNVSWFVYLFICCWVFRLSLWAGIMLPLPLHLIFLF